jgi:mRNA-degrading endonuclease RelE of RelBE toxin-antitoxin system
MRRTVRLDAALAASVLAHLPPQPKRRMKDALRLLGQDPTGRTVGLDVLELDTGDRLPRLYRLRVGAWRAVFAVDERGIIVTHIFHRRDGYGWLERLDAPGGKPEDA